MGRISIRCSRQAGLGVRDPLCESPHEPRGIRVDLLLGLTHCGSDSVIAALRNAGIDSSSVQRMSGRRSRRRSVRKIKRSTPTLMSTQDRSHQIILAEFKRLGLPPQGFGALAVSEAGMTDLLERLPRMTPPVSWRGAFRTTRRTGWRESRKRGRAAIGRSARTTTVAAHGTGGALSSLAAIDRSRLSGPPRRRGARGRLSDLRCRVYRDRTTPVGPRTMRSSF